MKKEDFPIKKGTRLQAFGDEYILALISENLMTFISITDGNRWEESIIVKKPGELSWKEFKVLVEKEYRKGFRFYD